MPARKPLHQLSIFVLFFLFFSSTTTLAADYTVTVSPAGATEGSQIVFTVALDQPVQTGDTGVHVDWETSEVTATNGSDFTTSNGTLTFNPGDQTETVTVNTTPDSIVEENETITITLSGAGYDTGSTGGNISLSGSPATGTITDDDSATVTVAATTQATEAGTDGQFTVTQTGPSSTPTVINYTVTGTATAGTDYTALSATVTIPAGNTTTTIPVPVSDDNTVEADETVIVTLSSITAGDADITVNTTPATVTITDDDIATLSIDNVTATEGGNAIFTIQSDKSIEGTSVSIDWSTSDDTALAGSDYTAASGTATITNGTSTTISIPVTQDSLVEFEETFTVGLSNPSVKAAIGTTPGTGTILVDDKYTLTIAPGPVTVAEPGVNPSTAAFTVTVSPSVQAEHTGTDAVTIGYTANSGTATSGSDFSTTTGTLEFAPGADLGNGIDVRIISVPISPDTVVEGSEQFTVNLSTNLPSAITQISTAQATGIIVDNDYQITTTWNNGGTVTLESPTGTPISLANDSTVDIADQTSATFTVTADHEIESVTIDGGMPVWVTQNIIDTKNHTYTFSSETDPTPTPATAHTFNVIFKHRVDMTAGSGGTITRTSPAPNTSVTDDTDFVIADHNSDQTFQFDATTLNCVSDVLIDGHSETAFASENNNQDGDTYTFNSISEDHMVEAVFSPPPVITVNVQADDPAHNTTVRADSFWRAYSTDSAFTNPVQIAQGVHGDSFTLTCDQQYITIVFSDVDTWSTPDPVHINMADDYQNQTVTGTYEALARLLTINITGHGTVNLDPEGAPGPVANSYIYTSGQSVELTPDPDPGWGFHLWQQDASGNATPLTITLNQDTVIEAVFVQYCQDADHDNYTVEDGGTGCATSAQLDCDDTNPTVYPGAPEVCGDGIDQDCDGTDSPCVGDNADDDGDGYTENQGDCDDTNSSIHPGALEICGDGLDQDCYDGDKECGMEETCVAASEEPLNAVLRPAPPLIMFLLDDSGSMDWEFMTDQSGGVYDGEYYIYNYDSRARNYEESREFNTDQRREWRAQWAGYNRIFYDATVTYDPWPKWHLVANATGENDTDSDPSLADVNGLVHADRDNPRLNSLDHGSGLYAWDHSFRMDMNAQFFSVTAAGSGQQVVLTRDNPDGDSTTADAIGLSTNPNLEINALHYWTDYDGTPPAPEIIFDNEDGPTIYSSNRDWPESGGEAAYEWAGGAKYTNVSGDWAKWMLNLTAAQEGDYYVYVWADDYGGRDRNALFSVSYYDGSGNLQADTFRVNQRSQARWHRLGNHTYHFSAQTGSTVIVPNAHYFTWYDVNGNGTRENGEIYLITIPGSAGSYELHYYNLNDANGNNAVDDGELTELTGAAIPSAIIPERYDSTGNQITDPVTLAAAERQNFVDWFSFYRRRVLTAKAAVGLTVADMGGVELGVHTINHSISEPLHYISDPDIIDPANFDMLDYLTIIYDIDPVGGTPLRDALYDVGAYFDSAHYPREDPTNPNYSGLNTVDGLTGSDTSVFYDAADGGSCQRAFVIAMTDGFYNGGFDGPGTYNKDNNQEAVFRDSHADTLADIAMDFYLKDLDPNLDDSVPAKKFDLADWQHLNMYGVSFGVFGNYNPKLFPDCLPDCEPGIDGCPELTDLQQEDCIDGGGNFTCTGPAIYPQRCPEWYKPNTNTNETIDDLFHASINGRGKFLNAANPKELIDSMKAIKDLISEQIGTASSVSLNANEIREGALLFQTIYQTEHWAGDVLAKCLDASGNIVTCPSDTDDVKWSAREQLEPITWDARNVLTYSGSTGIPFRFTDLSNNGMTNQLDTSAVKAEAILQYIRGDHTYERLNDTGHVWDFRDRNGKFGDIIHSEPYHYCVSDANSDGCEQVDWVLVGGNDGMMHALDGATGDEIFSYIPGEVIDSLHLLSEDSFDNTHHFYVDGFVDVNSTGAVDLLIGGLGRGGKGYYALNLTAAASSADPEADASAIVKWEYTATTMNDDDLGYSYSRPLIVSTNNGSRAVVFGNGYESNNGHAVLYVVFLDGDGNITGTQKIDTGIGDSDPASHDCNGLSTPALVDADFNGTVDFVYAGDLLGNLWKFDLRDADPANWSIAFNDAGTPKPLFQAVSASDGAGNIGYRQPITSRPNISYHCLHGVNGYLVVFGTGRLLGDTDYADQSVQTIYGVWDWANAWEEAGETAEDKFLGSFGLPANSTTIGTCQAECTAIKGNVSSAGSCIAECNGITECEETCASQEQQCKVNCSALRTLTNMDSILGSGKGNYVTLLRQSQEWIGGLIFGADGTEQIYGETNTDIVDQVVRAMSNNAIDWFLPDHWNSATGQYNFGTISTPEMHDLQSPKHVGWYFDLPANGERLVSDIMIVGDVVFYTSNIPSDSPCSGGGESHNYSLQLCTGGNPDTAFFDINGDGVLDIQDYINIGTPNHPRYVAVASIGVAGLAPGANIFRRAGGLDKFYVPVTNPNGGGGPGVPVNAGNAAGFGTGIFYWHNVNWQ